MCMRRKFAGNFGEDEDAVAHAEQILDLAVRACGDAAAGA
jgi:hypothetical protein